RLLPRVQVRGAVHLALEEQVLHRVLEAPDQQHPAVELERLVAVANGLSLGRLGAAHFAATGSSPLTRSAPRTYCRPATRSSSAVGQTAAIWSVVTPGRTSSIAESSHSRHCLYASS